MDEQNWITATINVNLIYSELKENVNLNICEVNENVNLKICEVNDGKNRAVVVEKLQLGKNQTQWATRELFGIKQACLYNPSSQGRLRAFSLSLIFNSYSLRWAQLRKDLAAAGAVVRAHKSGVTGATPTPTGDPFVEEVHRRSHNSNNQLFLPEAEKQSRNWFMVSIQIIPNGWRRLLRYMPYRSTTQMVCSFTRGLTPITLLCRLGKDIGRKT